MDAITLLKSAFDAAHGWYGGTVADVTEDVANVVPAGTAHPIGSQMAHIVQSEDALINMAQGRAPLWERDGYGQRLGLPFLITQTAEGSRAFRLRPADLADYTAAVHAQTKAYLDGLTPEDLDRPVDLSGWGMDAAPLGGFLANFALGNTFAHTGEISALKGTQGLRGYPF